jgi:hypothetical protein
VGVNKSRVYYAKKKMFIEVFLKILFLNTQLSELVVKGLKVMALSDILKISK